jgi:hypothetical protein
MPDTYTKARLKEKGTTNFLHPETDVAQLMANGGTPLAGIISTLLKAATTSEARNAIEAAAASHQHSTGDITNFASQVVSAIGTETLDALGVKYSITTNGYICFGQLFGGLILQWGDPTQILWPSGIYHENAIILAPSIVEELPVYRAKGSVSFTGLPDNLNSTMVGWVYNVYEDFTTDNRFVEGASKTYYAGENVAVVEVTAPYYALSQDTIAVEGKTYYEDAQGTELETQPKTGDEISGLYEYIPGVYKFDVLSGYIDLSNYVKVTGWDANTATLEIGN